MHEEDTIEEERLPNFYGRSAVAFQVVGSVPALGAIPSQPDNLDRLEWPLAERQL